MAKHTVHGFIVYHPETYWEDHERIDFQTYDPRNSIRSTAVLVREHSIEVEVPDDFDPRPQQIQALEKKRDAVRAEMSARITEINNQIQSLLAIESAA